MREVISGFFGLEARNVIPEIYLAMAGVWIIVLFVGISSIRSQHISRAGQLSWMAVIVFVPYFGMLAYTLFSFTRVNFDFLRDSGLLRSKANAKGQI